MAKEVPLDTLETNTTCSHCSVGCSLILESYGDILVKANPDKEGVVNAGLACGKGKWGFDCAVLEDKLEDPLIKEGESFREADYHEALTLIAKKMQATAAKYSFDEIGVAIFGIPPCLLAFSALFRMDTGVISASGCSSPLAHEGVSNGSSLLY